MPFVTAGDPDLETTAEIIRALDGQGCHLCEVGVPYSDPIADGPVIQASYTLALDKKIQLSAILKSMSQLTTDIRMPLVSMVSYAIVFRHGLEAYVDDARRSGLAGLIVPDLPIEESAALEADLCFPTVTWALERCFSSLDRCRGVQERTKAFQGGEWRVLIDDDGGGYLAS